MRTPHKAAVCAAATALFDHLVGEASVHVQGESLKALAALLVRLLNSPISSRGEREATMQDLVERHPAHQTQWAAQFAVASELCKRGYLVALTLGNHPAADLMVRSPNGTQFSVDVKGLYRRNAWNVTPKASQENLYYVLAFVPPGSTNRFFILNQVEVNSEVHQNLERVRESRTKKGLSIEKVGNWPVLLWPFAEQFENKWEILPA